MKIFQLLVAILLLGLAGASGAAQAQSVRSVIRDAEIESMLREWTTPIMQAAGLDPSAVHFVLVQDSDLNAFVAGGQNIFIYTGLLQKSDNPGEVIGVIAHEIGHIAGGHLVRARDEMETASYEVMLGTLLGLGAAIAGGGADAAAAISTASSTLAQRRFLAFSRTQESSADQAAVRFMRQAHMNPSGLVSFMQKLADQDLLPESQQNEYVRTHPISRDRVDFLQSSIGETSLRNQPYSAAWVEQHARMKSKLLGFITPQQVAWVYPDRDTSVAAKQARAIAAYRLNRVEEALQGATALIAEEPQNPYFYELKGQMLYDFGRVKEAVAFDQKAVALAPQEARPLLKLALAQAYIEMPGAGPTQLQQAVDLLEQVRVVETRNARLYRQLGIAYGRLGQAGAAQAALAEESFLQRRYGESRRQATGALKQLPPGSRFARRAQDLLDQIDQVDKEPAKKDPKDRSE